jgi:hypothetical protein
MNPKITMKKNKIINKPNDVYYSLLVNLMLTLCSGPYQCEICQKISDTKRLFVDHIRSEHKDVIDPSVLR